MPNHRASRAGRASLGLVAAGFAACAVVLVVDYAVDQGRAGPDDEPSAVVPEQPREVTTSRPAAPADASTPEPRRDPAAGRPRQVQVTALGIDVPVVPIQLESTTLVPPDDPQTLGWWADGAVPGARLGSALITGHTVHAGGGALDHLETLKEGQLLTVTTEAGEIDYEVSRVETFVKSRIAESAERLFSQRIRGRLVLVTCEDWNGVTYESNVVVIAHPV